MVIDERLIKIAYKKLKSSLYYDKTQSILRDKLVDFETACGDIGKYLDEFAKKFLCQETRKDLFDDILSNISYHAFPKNLAPETGNLIRNYVNKSIKITDNQYFIDMDIRGHILGVLWLLIIGYRIDEKMYAHSYGNRIRKKLYSEFSEEPTYSPYLFEPYFQQYESWRDKAMDEAMNHLHQGQDVVVLTLDFKRFYYSVDISQELMDEIYENEIVLLGEDSQEIRELNNFIYDVIVAYAGLFDEFNGLRILPIGFLPSNVLANYALKNFDKAILDGWNPIYFGRYVDDVIIVDKVEANSELYKKSISDELESKDIIKFFMEQCSNWKGLGKTGCKNNSKYSLLFRESVEQGKESYTYILNKLYNPIKNDNSRIVIKNDKVKIFYFKSGESDALITCFKENISKNKSEFRHMPEDETIFQKDDYSQIYDLQNDETINKFRGITGISIDKFELSKMLGKYLRIGGLINDEKENGFEVQICRILNPRVIIENYGVWEKIIEILVINESWSTLHKIVDSFVDAIDTLTYENANICKVVKETLNKYLYSVLSRALSLVWGMKAEEFIADLNRTYVNRDFISQHIVNESHRKAYCNTKMMDKSVMPIFVDMLHMEEIYGSKDKVNLSNYNDVILFCKEKWECDYVYYPYLITMYDFSIISCIEQLKNVKKPFVDLKEMYDSQINNYTSSNYHVQDDISKIEQFFNVRKFGKENIVEKSAFLIEVHNSAKSKLRIAIANVCLNHNNFEKLIINKPNRSYQRYRDLSKIINEAIDEKADLLIMPEAYVPFEWLSTVARTCARNNIAIVTGIEHIKMENNIFNLTAVILPYEDLANRSAIISFHLKNHYAPFEQQEINGYRLAAVEGNNYELYRWHDCYFPVYCCFELTSITERALFQSYADFLVAIEWNKDVNYYSNILESLSRDIHCYCVQVNSSDYGDSRITKPSKTEEKDIVRTKGGINSTILVDEIDIAKMRQFQLKGYTLQAYDKKFKPTPPGFNPDIVLKKINGEDLYE